MSKFVTRAGNQRKVISFVMVIALLIGAMFVPIQSMAGDGIDTVKVTFKLNSKEIKSEIPLSGDGKAKLKSDQVPDDPQSSETQKFLGWQNLSGKTQDEKNSVWTKKDLIKDFILVQDTEFKPVYEDITPVVYDNDSDTPDTKAGNDKAETTTPNSQKQKRSPGISVQANEEIEADLDGTPLGSGSEFTSDTYRSFEYDNTLNITANFDGNQTVAKKITIELAEGMAFQNIYGMNPKNTGTRNDWIQGAIPSPNDERIESITYEKSSVHVSGYQPRAGKVTYLLKPGVESITFSLDIRTDKHYMKNDGTLTIKDAIKIKSTQGTDSDYGSADLEKYTVSGLVQTVFYNYNVDCLAPANGDYKFNFSLFEGVSAGSGISRYIIKSLAIKLKMPKKAGMTGISPGSDNNSNSTIKPSDYVYSVDTSDSNNDIMTITFGAMTDFTAPTLYMEGTVASDAVVGDRYPINIVGSDAVLFNGDEAHKYIQYSSRHVKVIEDGDKFTLSTIAGNSIHIKDKDSPQPLSLLTSFNVNNENTSTISGMRMRVNFTDDAIGVQAAKLFMGKDGAKDIVVKTSQGREIYVANLSGTYQVANKSSYGILNLKTGVGGKKLNDDEYIESIEYSSGDIESGAYTYNGTYNGSQPMMGFWGRLIKNANSFSSTLTILKPKAPNAPYDDSTQWEENQAPYTQVINVNNAANTIRYEVADSDNQDILAGGNEKSVKVVYGIQNHRYNATQLRAYKGLAIYLVEDENITIDKDSITIINKGATFKPSTSQISETHDNQGRKVYKVTLPEAVIGLYNNSLGVDKLTIDFNVSAKSTAKNTKVHYGKMIFAHVINEEDKNASVYSNYSGKIVKDTLDLTSSQNNNLVIPNPLNYLNVQAQQKLTVNTYADAGDNNWKAYDFNDPSSVVSLNTLLDARYKVAAYNGSGKVMDSGYTAMIPIPKKGENAGSTLVHGSSDTFRWSLGLDAPLSLGPDYEVKYSTSYEFNKDSSTWKDWSSIGNKDNIRCVMVKCNKSIDKDETDDFFFNLKVPQGQDAIDATGLINEYSSVIYSNIPGVSSGNASSEPIALQLNTGIVSGKVMNDIDKNGDFSSGDTSMSGIQVRAYTPGGFELNDTPLASTVTDVNGEYRFINFSSTQHVDIVFISNATDINPMRFITPSATDTTHKYAKKANVLANADSTAKNTSALLQTPYKLTFNADGGSPVPDNQFVYINEKADEPITPPALEGNRFLGWYKGSAEFDFANTGIATDTALKAKWLKQHIITFDVSGAGILITDGIPSSGAEVSVGAIDNGTTWSSIIKVPTPAALSNDVYFKGWTPDLPSKTSKITTDKTYTAVFEPKQTLTFSALDADTKVYNGHTQSTETAVELEGTLVEGHTFKDNIEAQTSGKNAGDYDVTFGAITGSAFNSFDTTKGLDYYYKVNYVPGKFTISKKSLELTVGNEEREYIAGQALMASTTSAVGLISGHSIGVPSSAYTGSITNVGNTNGSLDKTKVTISDGSSDVTGNYDIIVNSGKLTIKANTTSLGIKANGKTVLYDGKSHGLSEAYGTLNNVKDSNATVVYSKSKNGTYSKTMPKYTDAGTHTIWVKAEKSNYKTTDPASHTVTINKREITITPKDVSSTYDGKAKSADSVNVSGKDGLASGQKLGALKFNGARTNVGSNSSSVSGTIKITDSSGKDSYESNYTVKKDTGTVQIDKRPVTIAPVSTNKEYDGNALTAKDIKVVKGSMASGEKLVNPKFSGSQTQVGKRAVSVTDVDVQGGSKANYSFKSDTGTLEVTRRNGPVTPPVDPPVTPPGSVDPPEGSDPNIRENESQREVTPPAPQTTTEYKDGSTTLKEQGIPTIGIGDNNIPLFGTTGVKTWAVINLILTVASVMLVLTMAVIAIARWREREKYEIEGQDDYYEEKKTHKKWLLVSAIAGVISIIVFALTQDMSHTMVLLDKWSIAHFILIVVTIFSATLIFRKEKLEDDYQYNDF